MFKIDWHFPLAQQSGIGVNYHKWGKINKVVDKRHKDTEIFLKIDLYIRFLLKKISGGSWLNLLVRLPVILKIFCTLCRQFICHCLAINVQIFRNCVVLVV